MDDCTLGNGYRQQQVLPLAILMIPTVARTSEEVLKLFQMICAKLAWH
jgi:ABC-type phosphate transport system permease subunit